MKRKIVLGVVMFMLLLGSATVFGKPVNLNVQGNKIPVESTTISKYDNGKVRYAQLAKPFTLKLGGVSYPLMANEYIYFYESGHVQMAFTSKDINYKGFTFKAETAITFFKNGKLQAGRINKSVQSRGFNLYPNDVIVLDEKGSLIGIMLLESQNLSFGGKYVWLYSGTFVAYNNADSYEVVSIANYSEGAYVTGSYLAFKDSDFIWIKYYNYEEGKISSVMRMNDGDFTYKGKTYKAKAMTPINFDQNGNLKQ